MLVGTTHTYPNTDTESGTLDFHHIDPGTISHAVNDLNKIVDSNATLLRHDTSLAQSILRYENLLLDAQGGDSTALKKATMPEEFDKIVELAQQQMHSKNSDDLAYLALSEDLLRFKAYYLAASRAD
jgi:hypothetical protein